MTSGSPRLLLLGTHDYYIYGVQFDPVAKTMTRTSSFKTSQDPSWLTRHLTKLDIIYANGHVEGKAFALRLVDELGNLKVLSEATSGGVGPTHLCVLEDDSAITFAHYGTGNITLVPLAADGTFASTSPTDSLDAAYEAIPHRRQESAHAHQIVSHKGELFVPDLGCNKVWRVKVEAGKLQAVGSLDGFEVGDGPRHCVVHPSGDYVYTITELSSYVTVHRITPGSSELISRLSILPPADEPHRPSLGASEIVLLPPVRAGGPSLLIASNRDSPNAEGDAIALFSVSANGSKVEPTPEGFVKGIGRHLRGVSADAEARFVAVCARNGGGLAMFERKGEDGLQLEEVARLDVERTVCPLWIS